MKSLAILLCILIAFPALQAQSFPTELNHRGGRRRGGHQQRQAARSSQPLIRVEDENHKPVAGVAVVFTLPTEGATGEFGNGAKTLTVLTDREGMAAAQGLRMNPVAGKIPIHINASYRGLTARAVHYPVLRAAARAPSRSRPAVEGPRRIDRGPGGARAAAAGGGVYLATRQKKVPQLLLPAGPTPIGITPGTGTITGGR